MCRSRDIKDPVRLFRRRLENIWVCLLMPRIGTSQPQTLHFLTPHRLISDLLASHRGANARSSLEATTPTPTPGPGSDEDQSTGNVTVLPSSTELFYAIGHGMDDCLRLVGGDEEQGVVQGVVGQMLAMYKKWLKVYAGQSFTNHNNCADSVQRTC